MILTKFSPRVLPPDEIKLIAESMIGPISWESSGFGICSCPGKELHSSATRKRDSMFFIDGVPTLYCHHNSCSAAVEQANHRVRSAIGKAKAASGSTQYRPSIQEQLQRGERLRIKQEEQQLASLSRESLPLIIEQYPGSTADLWEESLVRLLDDPEDGWRLLLHLV